MFTLAETLDERWALVLELDRMITLIKTRLNRRRWNNNVDDVSNGGGHIDLATLHQPSEDAISGGGLIS